MINARLHYYLGGLVFFTALVQPCAAWSQPVDYNSLESIFGEPITTSATGTPQRASEVAANMTIITADEIRQSGARSVPEVLARVPGINILREGINDYDVGIRGYRQPANPRLLVLIDGRQVFVDDYSRTIWDNLPVNIDDIRQIEVVKGASSALFGPNAASGVINIVTYSPLYDNNNVVTAGFGTQRTRTGDATITARRDWGGTKISAGGLNANEFDPPRSFPFTAPGTEGTPFHRYIANNSVLQVTPALQATTEFTYSESTANLVDPQGNYEMAGENARSWSARLEEDWQTRYGLISNNNYFNRTHVALYEPAFGVSPVGADTDLFVSQLQDQFRVGSDHTFRVSGEYRHKTFSVFPQITALLSPSIAEQNIAASGTWVWNITDQLTWTNALRYDRQSSDETGQLLQSAAFNSNADFSQSHGAVSANSNFIYKPTPMDTFRLGYGRGIEFPSLVETDGDGLQAPFGVPLDLEGNPYLKPTIVQDFDLDYERKLPQILSIAKISAFYEWNQDLIAPFVLTTFRFINGSVTPVVYGHNVGESHGFGGEIELKGNHNGIRWDASYSLAHVVDSALADSSLNYSGSPDQQFRLDLGYTTGPWEFDANGQYITSANMFRISPTTFQQAPATVKGYGSIGGRIGYNINKYLTLALSGANLTRATTVENPYPAVERQALITLTGRW